MKRFATFALSAVLAWLAFPATTTALEAPDCSAANGQSCTLTHEVETFEIDANGNRVWTRMECDYQGIDEEPAPGGVNVYCNYGDCGRILLGPS